MRDINQRIKETAQFWSKFLKENLTSGLGKALEIPDGDLETKIKFGMVLEDSMITMQKETASIADRFEEILIQIFQEIIQSYPEYQKRKFLDYENCKLLSYSESSRIIQLSFDYQPNYILKEAIHRTSLETGVDLANKVFFLFPSKAWNSLTIYQNDLSLIEKTSSLEIKKMLNVTEQDYKRCEYLRDLRISYRKTAIKAREAFEAATQPLSSTMQEKIILSAKSGAAHGLLRGITKSLGDFLKKNNVPENKANKISRAAYYGGIFTMSFSSQSENIVDLNSYLNAMYCSTIETGQFIILDTGLGLLTNFIKKASRAALTKQWTRAGKALDKCSSLVQYGIFVQNAIGYGVATTAASLGAGFATQCTVEQIGKRLFDI